MYYTEKELMAFKKFDGTIDEFKDAFDFGIRAAVEDIIKREVCGYFNISPFLIQRRGRKREIVIARQVIAFMLWGYTFMTLERIGQCVNQDHSNIVSAVRAVNNQIDTDLLFATHVQNIENGLDGLGLTRRFNRKEKRTL